MLNISVCTGCCAGLLGSGTATLAYFVWDANDLRPFQATCWGFATIAGVGWWLSGSLMELPKPAPQQPLALPPQHVAAPTAVTVPGHLAWARRELAEWSAFARQLFSQPDFVAYCAMNWLMNFNVTLSQNFFASSK